MTTVHVIIPAAGRGARFSTSGANKVFASVCGRPILSWTASAFSDHPRVDSIVVVAAPGEEDACRSALDGIAKVTAVVTGGDTRQKSVALGLTRVPEDGGIVLVHDAARPLIRAEVIDRCIDGAIAHGGAVAALPVADTLKAATVDGRVERTVPRDGLWAMQTPQAFPEARLRAAHIVATESGFVGTDEASLIERAGGAPVHLVMGSLQNFKVTLAEDAALADAILRSRKKELPMRVGFGYDIHRFADGRRLVLGGVEFPPVAGKGLDGHSDADVLLHAICDALLGAAGLPDIGHLYPNTDSRYSGIASTLLLQDVRERLAGLGYRVSNVDATLIAEAPKIGPRVEEIRGTIAEHLGIERDLIGVKATTNEGIGSLGHGEGIAAHAVASIFRT